MVKTSSKTIALSDFRAEFNDLLHEVTQKINASATQTFNFDMHENYKLDIGEIDKRLQGIKHKFRKCEMNYHLYFDEIHHDILTVDQRDLPISRQRLFIDGTAKTTRIFDVDDKKLYQEIIDCQFQEFILFTSSVIENLVYLAETLIRKVVVHLKNKQPLSIIMQTYIATLDILIKLDYRKSDLISTCLMRHQTFFETYLPTINAYRNAYIHGYRSRLNPVGTEYMLDTPIKPIYPNTLNATVDIFAKNVLDNVRVIIPDFLTAITQTIKAGTHVPA